MDTINGQEVDGKPVRWSWESMWALACPDHKPWILAGYDLTYVAWLEQEVAAFRTAYTLVAQTIDHWNHIEDITTNLYGQQLITLEDYMAETIAIEAEIAPEMHAFNPIDLPDCLERIEQDGKLLSHELSLALWQAPVTWQ
jgi:hypothetical protein